MPALPAARIICILHKGSTRRGCTGTPTPPISLAAYKWSFLFETDFCLRWCQFFMFQGDWERGWQEEQADNRFIGRPHRVAAPSFRQPHGAERWRRGCQSTLPLHTNCYSTKSYTKLTVDIKSTVKTFKSWQVFIFLRRKKFNKMKDFFPHICQHMLCWFRKKSAFCMSHYFFPQPSFFGSVDAAF